MYQTDNFKAGKPLDLTDAFKTKKPTRQEVLAYVRELAASHEAISTKTEGISIGIYDSSKKVKHVVGSSTYETMNQQERKRHGKYLLNITDIIQNAVYDSSLPEKKGKTHITAYHYFTSPVRVGNTVYDIKLVTEEFTKEFQQTEEYKKRASSSHPTIKAELTRIRQSSLLNNNTRSTDLSSEEYKKRALSPPNRAFTLKLVNRANPDSLLKDTTGNADLSSVPAVVYLYDVIERGTQSVPDVQQDFLYQMDDNAPLNKSSIRQFFDGPAVFEMASSDMPHVGNISELANWANEYYEVKVKNTVLIPDIGKVKLDKRAVKDSLSHGYGKDKVNALYMLPDVLPKTKIIFKEQRNKITGYYVGAPVKLDGKNYILAAIIRSDNNSQRLYVHEIILKEKILGAIKTAAETGKPATQNTDATQGSIRSILQDIFIVNDFVLGDTLRENEAEQTHSGSTDFCIQTTLIKIGTTRILDLQIAIDTSSLEIFLVENTTTIANRIYSSVESTVVSITAPE